MSGDSGTGRDLLTDRQRRYALGLLLLFYTSNFLDRGIINILAEPIKLELGLSDTQLGVLSGLAFALFYSILGLPLGRLADRWHRVNTLSICAATWSGMTVVCGFAMSFWQLFAARVGVGIGEAGCTPSAHSLISDMYPPQRRATALSVYSLGIPIGSILGTVAGGWVGQVFGWRAAFMLVGAPGLLLAIVAKLTLVEPRRGRFDGQVTDVTPAWPDVVRYLARQRVFIHVLTGMALATFAGAGILTFAAPFLLRGPFEIDLARVGLLLGVTIGLGNFFGIGLGGFLCDRTASRDDRLRFWIPAAGFLCGAPLLVASLVQTDISWFIVYMAAAQMLVALYVGPSFSAVHNIVHPRVRASATAIVLLMAALVGFGLGPTFVGWLSDLLAGTVFADTTQVTGNCGARPSGAAPLEEVCHRATFEGLRFAMMAAAAVNVWAACHYLIAARCSQSGTKPDWPSLVGSQASDAGISNQSK